MTVESIAIEGVKETLILGEKVQAVARVLPENAENQAVTWTSSDENVVTIDPDGLLVAVGGGSSTISATSENNVIGSVDILVDGTKRKMNLKEFVEANAHLIIEFSQEGGFDNASNL